MAATRANQNRKIRQDALREELSKKKLVEKVLDNIKLMDEHAATMDSNELNARKVANDQRLRLISKYLPDLKQSEIDIRAEDVTGSNRAELEARLIAEGIDPTDI